MARQLNLEKHFIMVEKNLKNGITKKDSVFPAVEDFSNTFYQNIETFSAFQDVNFSKIVFYTVKLI